HAVSGILPIKSISIPPDQYRHALGHIALTFLTAPVLSSEDHLKISLAVEDGFEWTWLERNSDRLWQEITQQVLITKGLFNARFPDQPALWNDLVKRRWLQLLEHDPEKALI